MIENIVSYGLFGAMAIAAIGVAYFGWRRWNGEKKAPPASPNLGGGQGEE